MSFLTAEWRKVAFANYEVDPKAIMDLVPAHTELDLRNGKCFISLVGFMFLNTRAMGIRLPYHVNFEEVNLRLYVKRKDKGEWKRGVVFIKEIVPRPFISFIANTVYRENYMSRSMQHAWVYDDALRVTYKWLHKHKWNTFQVKSDLKYHSIIEGSDEEFITEHYWGYVKCSAMRTLEYHVTHPKWDVYNVNGYTIDVDYAAVYGERFRFLNGMEPASVMLAEGSDITVEKNRRL